MTEETISEEQVLHNKLSFEINQELIHLMKRIVEIQQENQQLKEVFEKSYTSEQLDFAVNEVKEELKAEKDITNNLHKTIDKLRVSLYETQQQRDLYKEVIEEVRRVLRCNNIEVLKYHDEPSETTSYELVTVDILQILDKAKEMSNE